MITTGTAVINLHGRLMVYKLMLRQGGALGGYHMKYLSEIDHDVLRQLHVFEHSFQFACEASTTLCHNYHTILLRPDLEKNLRKIPMFSLSSSQVCPEFMELRFSKTV